MTGVTRGDRTEGGEEGKGEGGERGEEEGHVADGTDGIEGSIRGHRGPKKIGLLWYCGIRNSALAVEGMEECFYSRTTAQ